MRSRILVIVIFFLMVPYCVRAQEIDVNKKGSFHIFNRYGERVIPGSKIHIFKIASSNNRGEFSYVDSISMDDSLEMTSASLWNDLALKVSKYVSDYKVDSISECITDSNGSCSFPDLDVGLYLIISSSVVMDDYQYSSNPVLVAVPNYNEIDYDLIYDEDIILKTEAKSIKKEESSVKNLPKTGDDIFGYIVAFVVSFVALIILYLCYFRKKGRK